MIWRNRRGEVITMEQWLQEVEENSKVASTRVRGGESTRCPANKHRSKLITMTTTPPPPDDTPEPMAFGPGPYFVRTADTVTLRDPEFGVATDPTAAPIDREILPLDALGDQTWGGVARFFHEYGAEQLRTLPWSKAFTVLADHPMWQSMLRDMRNSRHIEVAAEPEFAALLVAHGQRAVEDDGHTQGLADWWNQCGLLNADHEKPWVEHMFGPTPTNVDPTVVPDPTPITSTEETRAQDQQPDQPTPGETGDHPEGDDTESAAPAE